MSNQFQIAKAAATAVAHDKAAPLSRMADVWLTRASQALSREYPASTELFRQDSAAQEVYLVEKGLVKLSCVGEDGQELIVGLRSSGAILGAASAIVRRQHSVTAITLSACHLFRLGLDAFLELVRTDAQFAWHLQQAHSREVHEQAGQLIGLRYLSARQRFEQLVWQLISATGLADRQGPVRVDLPLKHWEIAQLVGVTPEHLSRVVKQLQQERIMRRENGSLIVSDYKSLYHPFRLGGSD